LMYNTKGLNGTVPYVEIGPPTIIWSSRIMN
jgi:hypothetical protein